MTNTDKSIELSNKFKCITIGERCKNIEDACYKMAQWKDEQLKEVCKKCEQHIIDSGKDGCAYRSLGNEYCWED